MDLKIRRIGLELPGSAKPANWLGECRLLFLSNKSIGRFLVGRVFGDWNETIYLQVVEERDLFEREPRLRSLYPDFYVDPGDQAFVLRNSQLVRPGLCDIKRFLRLFQSDEVRGDEYDLWRWRMKILREIRDYSHRIDIGVYKIWGVPYPNYKREPEELVRTPDFAGGGITDEEQEDMMIQTKRWIDHLRRTEPIAPEKVDAAVKDLYEALGLEAPRVVITPNPIIGAIAGSFAAVVLESKKKPSGDESKRNHEDFWITDRVYDATCLTAQAVSLLSIDRYVQLSISERLNPTRFGDKWRLLNQDATDKLRECLESDTGTVFSDSHDLDTVVSSVCDAISSCLDLAEPSSTEAQVRELLTATTTENNKFAEQFLSNIQHLRHHLLCVEINTFVSTCKNTLGLQLPVYELYSHWERIAYECVSALMHVDFCLVTDFPTRMNVDQFWRLHCADGPSLKWRDGWSFYHWHGVRVPRHVIEEPESITTEEINGEKNVEVRRVMMQQYGVSKFLMDSGAEEIDRSAFGILYRLGIENDEPIVMVKVINSTPEPDGTCKEYFLRVPPETTSAREAVAWTFNMRTALYKPTVQS